MLGRRGGANVRLDCAPAPVLAVRPDLPRLLPVTEVAMGFNAMQPGKIKRGDVIMLVAAIVIVIALVVWAIH